MTARTQLPRSLVRFVTWKIAISSAANISTRANRVTTASSKCQPPKPTPKRDFPNYRTKITRQEMLCACWPLLWPCWLPPVAIPQRILSIDDTPLLDRDSLPVNHVPQRSQFIGVGEIDSNDGDFQRDTFGLQTRCGQARQFLLHRFPITASQPDQKAQPKQIRSLAKQSDPFPVKRTKLTAGRKNRQYTSRARPLACRSQQTKETRRRELGLILLVGKGH